jgi:hypothetical protein
MSGPAQLMHPEPLGGFGQVHLAAAGFLARSSGGTRVAYGLDLRSFFAWCAERGMPVFEVTRPQTPAHPIDRQGQEPELAWWRSSIGGRVHLGDTPCPCVPGDE